MKIKMGRYLSKQLTLVKSLDLVRGADIFFWYSLGFSIAVTCRWNSDYGNYGKTICCIMFQRVSSCAEKIFFIYDCWMLYCRMSFYALVFYEFKLPKIEFFTTS